MMKAFLDFSARFKLGFQRMVGRGSCRAGGAFGVPPSGSPEPRKRGTPNGASPCLVAGVFAALLATGCVSHSFDIKHVADVRYQPSNIYRKSLVLDPRVKRVAVLPITTASSTESFIDGASKFQPLVCAELEKTKRFDLVIISPEQLRVWTGQTTWRDDEVLPPDFFRHLREQCGCDAVFFTQMTRYYPYQPVAIGWKLSLAEVDDSQVVWKADEVFDAGDMVVANAAEHYSDQHVHIEGPADDPAAILGSPSRFGQYSLSALMATLPVR